MMAYNETAAKAAFLEQMMVITASQDLSEDLRPQSRALVIVFTILAAVIVALRFVARRRQGAAILADDWMILASLAMLFANSITVIICR